MKKQLLLINFQLTKFITLSYEMENQKKKSVIQDQFSPRISSLNIGSLGTTQDLAGAIAGTIQAFYGNVGRIDVRVTNKTNKIIKLQLINRKGKRSAMEDVTRFYSKKARDGPGRTTHYELDIRWEDKRKRIFIYGKNAPRKDNRYEVREQGIFLVENEGEFKAAQW